MRVNMILGDQIAQANCILPVKYLRYLGWSIIGILGTVKRDREGDETTYTVPLQGGTLTASSSLLSPPHSVVHIATPM